MANWAKEAHEKRNENGQRRENGSGNGNGNADKNKNQHENNDNIVVVLIVVVCELRELRMAKGTIKEKCLRWPLSKTKIEAIPLTLGIHKHIRTRAHTQDLTCTPHCDRRQSHYVVRQEQNEEAVATRPCVYVICVCPTQRIDGKC